MDYSDASKCQKSYKQRLHERWPEARSAVPGYELPMSLGFACEHVFPPICHLALKIGAMAAIFSRTSSKESKAGAAEARSICSLGYLCSTGAKVWALMFWQTHALDREQKLIGVGRRGRFGAPHFTQANHGSSWETIKAMYDR
eukprot:3007702-Rhodomonas_salina.3